MPSCSSLFLSRAHLHFLPFLFPKVAQFERKLTFDFSNATINYLSTQLLVPLPLSGKLSFFTLYNYKLRDCVYKSLLTQQTAYSCKVSKFVYCSAGLCLF